MKPEPLDFSFPVADFDLAKLPIDPKLAEAVDAGKIEDAKLPDALSGALSTVEGLLGKSA